ncbi:cyclopropane-fatty-acyl-phospholipid synthase family protein [Puniceicoccaceae bacterium K14]|nr:cyclopropane-fatty-acyl-phospholipid synthase family protein [Puniceicoccaceae bacterium K14]
MLSLYKKTILKCLQKGTIGGLTITLPDSEQIQCGNFSHKLQLNINDDRFFQKVANKGAMGLGESYQLGYWTSNNLTGVLIWFLENKRYIEPNTSPMLAAMIKRVNSLGNFTLHYRNRNTIEQSVANIHAHYDLGNDFYKAFLDPSMTYSSGYFTDSSTILEESQYEKYDRICRKLGLDETNHVLEVGCGWGGFSMYAVKNYGCKVTATTISQNQFDEAKIRIEAAGLQGKINLIQTDYRQLTGKYDRIVSIEMIEAVGQEFLSSYFKQLETLLAPDGLIAIQAITCPNPVYDNSSRKVDWIQKHIFPGSHLPSNHALIENAEKQGELDLYHMESFGIHYARTLREWKTRFLNNWPEIQKMGFDEAFKNKWVYYLCYCEAGFLQRHVNVCQIVFGRADETAFQFELDNKTKQQPNTLTSLAS